MEDQSLMWQTLARRKLLHTPIYDVFAQTERSAAGQSGEYLAIEAPDWIMTVPVYRDKFVMVRQWRHGEGRLTVEFPGGVADPGEAPDAAARRELLEETGFRAGKMTHLGTCSPNPALFCNHVHVYLAEELVPTGEQHLDDDELLAFSLMPIDEVIASFGDERFTHALMGAALAFYLRRERAARQGAADGSQA